MKRKVVFGLALFCCLANAGVAQVVLQDGFEGPWDFPETVFADGTGGGGFDEDWFVDHVDWVGDMQFQLDQDYETKTEGDCAQIANSAVNDGNVRDLYLVRVVTGLETGKTYKLSIDYRFDRDDQSNYIQYTVREGDCQSRTDVADIEQYSGHDRPDTLFVDSETFGDGEFHTLTHLYTHTADGDSCSFMAIVRFWATDLENNWLWLDNFVVEEEMPVSVSEWQLY